METPGEFDLGKMISTNTEHTNENNVFSLTDNSFNLPLRITSFSSEKELDAFIKSVEKTIRHSIEYRYWVSYITDTLGERECALTHETLSEVTLEIHHHPINLYSVVKAVISDCILKNAEFSSFDIATKVIELHYQNKIGYVVMISDLHRKYHSGFLRIPIELVHGNYKFLLNTFQFDELELQRIYELCNMKAEDLKLKWSKDNYPGVDDCIKKLQADTPQQKVIGA